MISKKRLLKDSRLYVVLDKEITGKPLVTLNRLKDKGVDIVQLRDKMSSRSAILSEARRIKSLLKGTSVIFIINDYVDIAQLVDADGLHLGQGDLPISLARRLLGKDKIIGLSCHSQKQAFEAEKNGADYISIGPIFYTSTKPEYKPVGIGLLKKVSQGISIPIFAIGGLNLSNIYRVLSYGATGIAVCSLLRKKKSSLYIIKRLNTMLLKG